MRTAAPLHEELNALPEQQQTPLQLVAVDLGLWEKGGRNGNRTQVLVATPRKVI